MPPAWIKPLGDLAQIKDDFFTRSKSVTIKALTHASIALKRMSEQEFDSCNDAFFLSTRNGLILVLKRLTESVKPFLRFYLKGVVDSDPTWLRKGGYSTFAKMRDSTKLNLTRRVVNQHDYPECTYDEADCRFVPVLLTDNVCSFAEGYLINLLWNRTSNLRALGEFPVGTNRKGVQNAYGDVQLSHMHPGCLYIHSVHAGIDMKVHDEQLDAHKKEVQIRRNTNKENIAPVKTRPIDSFFSAKIPPVDLSRQDLVDGILEEELFPETVEILLETDSKEDMNSMISSLRIRRMKIYVEPKWPDGIGLEWII